MTKIIIGITHFLVFLSTAGLSVSFTDPLIIKKAYIDTCIGIPIPGASLLLSSLSSWIPDNSLSFLEGKDPILDLQVVFHESELMHKQSGSYLHEETLFQKVLLNIKPLKNNYLSIEDAFKKLNNDNILTSTNIKHCLKYPQHANEVASALVELRSRRFADGSPPLLHKWINQLSPMHMNAALNALYAHGAYTRENVTTVLDIMRLLKNYPDITLDAYLVGKSTRYGVDRSYLSKNVSAWQYAYSMVINLTRSLSTWTGDEYLYNGTVRSLSFTGILPDIIEAYILSEKSKDTHIILPALFSQEYIIEKYQESLVPKKNNKIPDNSIDTTIAIKKTPKDAHDMPFKIDRQLFANLNDDLKNFIVELSSGYDNATRFSNLSMKPQEELPFSDPITLGVMQIPVIVPRGTSVVGQNFCLLSLIEHGNINGENFLSIPNTLDWINLKDIIPDRDTQEEFNQHCSIKRNL